MNRITDLRNARARSPRALRIVLALAVAPALAVAAEPAPPDAAPGPALSASAAAVREPSPRDPGGPDARNALVPAGEILVFDILLNRANRYLGTGRDDYAVTLNSIRRNLRSGWGTDRDPFSVNQFAHPYQGGMYHGFARSAGFGYWESLGYTFAGSAFWEIFGEQTRPSRNDQVASGIGGTFLGEALFRMSNLVLEQGGGLPRFWRETAAAAISPSSGFNRLVFTDAYGGLFPSHGAAYYSRLQLGVSHSLKEETGFATGDFKPNEAQLDFALDYGLPGLRDYEYARPFDYFNFRATASSANGLENVLTRGLLIGKPYEAGPDYRGVWGLYGSYDYIAPQTFRVSTTAISLGTTAQWWLPRGLALQGTAMAGLGYTAVGTAHGSASDRDYNYGVTPQALLALRLTDNDRAALDVTGREYFVSNVGSGTSGGHDNIVRLDASLTVRLHKQHAVSLRYVGNRRDATFAGTSGTQTRNTIGLFYTLLGQDRFGATDWR